MKSDELLVTIGEAREYYLQSARDSREQGMHAHKRLRLRHALLIAASIALMLLLMGSTVAVMRLQDLTLRQPQIKPDDKATQSQTGSDDVVIGTNTTEEHNAATVPMGELAEEINLISLQGYMGSDSYAAFKEWQEFRDAYDPDKSILYANNKTFKCPEAYASYHCYSQEMVDKVDEICEKYGLQPLGNYWYLTRGADVCDAVGIESIFSGSAETGYLDYYGYCFRDGTFSMDGTLELTGKWSSLVNFSYRCVQKTSFDGVAMNIGDVSKYDQWNYTMRDGTKVLLALRDEAALIIVDREDSFITMGITGEFSDGTACRLPEDREFLETVCDAFDFTYQTQQVDPAEADALYQAQLEREKRGEKDRVRYQVDYDYPDTYAGIIDFMVNEQKYTGLNYALIDIDGDGVEEMLLQCVSRVFYDGHPDSFFAIYTMKDGEPFGILVLKRSNLYLCHDGVFDQCYYESSGHEYMKLLAGMEALDYVVYNEKDGNWYANVAGEDGSATHAIVTEEEAKAIIAKYPRIDLDFRPVSEFPRQ